MPEIIRLGDSTSHGGKVIEGSESDICMGKPIAFIGHKVQCPKCKGIFPIVEGAQTTTFYGKGVALAGMHTACGAVLIASQFTDTVELGGGAASATRPRKIADQTYVSEASSESEHASAAQMVSTESRFDDRFTLLDADSGEPLSFTEYAIRRATGEFEYGTSDADGRTHLLSATAKAETVELYI